MDEQRTNSNMSAENLMSSCFHTLTRMSNKLGTLSWKITQKDIKLKELKEENEKLEDRMEELKDKIQRLEWQNERLRYEYMNEGVDVNDGWGVHHIADIPYGEVGLDGKVIEGCDRITDEDEKKTVCSI